MVGVALWDFGNCRALRAAGRQHEQTERNVGMWNVGMFVVRMANGILVSLELPGN